MPVAVLDLAGFLSGVANSNVALPSLVHSTKGMNIYDIVGHGRLDTRPCPVFKGEKLLYFFVGRPAYKSQDLPISEFWLTPIAFVFQNPIERFLEESPTSDRFWVGKFRDYLYRITADSSSEYAFYADRFAILASRWARECAAKADTKVLKSFVDAISKFGPREREFDEAQTFALMRHIVSKPSASRVVARELERLREEIDAPSVVDYLTSSQTSLDPEFVSSFDQLARALRTALIHGRRSEIEGYTRLFGSSRSLPTQVSEVAHQLASFKHAELSNLVGIVFSSKTQHSRYVLQSLAIQGVETAKLLEAVYKLIYPEQREADLYQTHLMGIDRRALIELKSIAEGRFVHPIPPK